MKILVVDDGQINRKHYQRLMRDIDGCSVVAFPSAEEALAWCESSEPDCAIVDYVLPGIDGLEFIRRFRDMKGNATVPVLMISAYDDKKIRLRALALGAVDFVNQPVDVDEFPLRISNLVSLRSHDRDQAVTADWLAEQVNRATSLVREREREAILRLTRLAEYRDAEAVQHIVRVAHFCRAIAYGAGLGKDFEDMVFDAAPMHDIGKIAIPDYIALKPGKLTSAEFELMKQHTVIGHEILRGSSSPLLNAAAEVALTHHEKYDGSGYPHGLKGADIPLAGRVCALADSFDVMTSDRPYKAARSVEQALAEINRCGGAHFDPALVKAFTAVLPDVVEIKSRFSEGVANLPDSEALAL